MSLTGKTESIAIKGSISNKSTLGGTLGGSDAVHGGVNNPHIIHGKDGISATHEWNGTVLTITSASGTSSADLKGDKGDKGDSAALYRTVSGEGSIMIDDVSPISHNVVVTLANKNLLNNHTVNGNETKYGITLTENGDGTYTIKGTARENASFYIHVSSENPLYLKKGVTYTISGGIPDKVGVYVYRQDWEEMYGAASVESKTFTIEDDSQPFGSHIYITKGTTVDGIIKPMLEISDTATEFVPNEDISTSFITVLDKNGEGEIYYPNEEGIISDVKSYSPTMKIQTHPRVFIITATYERDLSKVIADLEERQSEVIQGENGATFTPSVSDEGVISWTNDKGLDNPDPVNIKGQQGEKGEKGADGIDGIDGTNGVSPTVTVVSDDEGYVMTVFDAVHGEKFYIIKHGKNGKDYVLTEADKIEIASMVNSSAVIPEYWQSELEAKADAIQQAMETAGKNKSAFLWYTDAHWVNGNSKMSPKLLNYLYMNTPMNKVNFGGDIIGDTLKATREEMKYLYEWRKAIKDLPNHHSVFGNHDMFDLDTVDYEDDNYRYAFLLAPEESSDMVMGDGNYYYIDNPCEKTRYLYIAYMTTNLTAMMAQGQFICDAMKAVPEGWHIVAIAHRWWQYSASATPTTGAIPAYEADMLSVFDAYNARATRSGSNYFAAQDFTQAKGKVEFCIGGHIHVDYDIESEGGIPIIITTADANQNRVPDSEVDCGTVGTTTEAAVFGIIADYNDTNNTKITVVGVGRGTSRVVRNSSVKPTSISNITYNGSTTIGATIDKSKFSFTVDYSNGTTDTVNGATSVSPATIGVVGNNTVTITYTEGGTTLSGTATIVGTEVPVVNLLSLNRTYEAGTTGEGLENHLDESKAYPNVAYGSLTFVSAQNTVSDITENSVTLKESGMGGTTVAYAVHLPDIATNDYRLTFNYSGTGKCRTYYRYAKVGDKSSSSSGLYINDTAGASGSAEAIIPKNTGGYDWVIIMLGSNTSGTKTFENVSLTKVE